jgi:hypothetical protein
MSDAHMSMTTVDTIKKRTDDVHVFISYAHDDARIAECFHFEAPPISLVRCKTGKSTVLPVMCTARTGVQNAFTRLTGTAVTALLGIPSGARSLLPNFTTSADANCLPDF